MGILLAVQHGAMWRWFWRNAAIILLTLSSLLCPLWGTTGCGSAAPTIAAVEERFPPERIRAVCWYPPELGPTPKVDADSEADPLKEYFVFPGDSGVAASEKDALYFRQGVSEGGFIYKYDVNAPVKNLRLLPLSRVDAWCTRIPKPTNAKVRELLGLCPEPTAQEEGRSAAKNLLGQNQGVPIRSGIFCGQPARMAPTTAEFILWRARQDAFQRAKGYALKIAIILTLAEADMQAVINKDHWSLKRLFTSHPGSVEQVQQRLADQLNDIEPPPELDDPALEPIAMAGYIEGFDNGKFEVEAKLFAIDAGIVILEVVAMELALGPLGGAKLLASAVSKGGKALTAAAKRLENIPIFIPGATSGVGGFVTIGKVINAVRRGSSTTLANALIASGITRPGGTDAHHIVALGHRLAAKSREKLAQFGVDLDKAVNGVFLPSNMKSPNAKGAIVHATLANNHRYYKKVEDALTQAKSQREVLEVLGRIRKTLLDGTFYDATL